MNINSYGISITTLEEVFLKVAEGSDISHRFSKLEDKNSEIDDFELNAVKIKGQFALFFVHFWALIMKRINYFKRDKKGLVCEIILPCIVIVLGLCLTFIKFVYPSPALELGPSLLSLPIETPTQLGYEAFYQKNFDAGDYKFLTNGAFDNKDVFAFDKFAFDERFADTNGLYGAFFINGFSENKYNYLAFVKELFSIFS